MVLTAEEAAAGNVLPQPTSVVVLPVQDAGVADVIGAARLLVSKAALPALAARASGTMAAADEKTASAEAAEEKGGRLMDASQMIIRPVVSEKTYVLAELGKYTFRVADKAHKTQIRQAIEELFDVKVVGVRTSSVKIKPKRRGQTAGRTRQWKKAIVEVADGQSDSDLPRPGGR